MTLTQQLSDWIRCNPATNPEGFTFKPFHWLGAGADSTIAFTSEQSYALQMHYQGKAYAFPYHLIDLSKEAISEWMHAHLKHKALSNALQLMLNGNRGLRIGLLGAPFYSDPFIFSSRPIPASLLNQIPKLIGRYQELSSDWLMLKDAVPESPLGNSWLPVPALHVMGININPQWTCLEDYLNALASKYRLKARKALELGHEIEVRSLSLKEVKACEDKLNQLLNQILVSSMDQYLALPEDILSTSMRLHGSHYRVNGWYKDGALIAFASYYIANNRCYAHLVGYSAAHNFTHALYANLLLDFIKQAIESRCLTVVFGRTAAEFKSNFGASPIQAPIYLRVKKKILRNTLKELLPSFYKEEGTLRQAFKQNRAHPASAVK